MSATTWVLLRSWHVRVELDDGRTGTLCGRIARRDASTAVDLPGAGRSCETCLRIAVRLDELAERYP